MGKSFFKKLGSGITSIAKKAPAAVTSIFRKGENLAGKVVGGLDKVGDVLGNVADIGGKILSNPITESLATGIGGAFGMPEAGALLGMAGRGLSAIKKGSDLARGAANIGRAGIGASKTLRSGDLQGGINQARDTIQKAKDLRDSAGVSGPQFV